MNRSSVHLNGIVALVVLTLAVSAIPGQAGEYFETDGVAIRGYDPVAYVQLSRPVKGSPLFAVSHGGTTFHFASETHRRAFLADPAAYLPQYGGYCAYGMALGYKAVTDPAAFTIVNKRLYLNYDLKVRRLWSADIPAHIGKADRNWPNVKSSTKVVQ